MLKEIDGSITEHGRLLLLLSHAYLDRDIDCDDEGMPNFTAHLLNQLEMAGYVEFGTNLIRVTSSGHMAASRLTWPGHIQINFVNAWEWMDMLDMNLDPITGTYLDIISRFEPMYPSGTKFRVWTN